jgi:hypothetical protein
MASLDEFRPKQSRAVATVNSLLDAAIEEIETLGEDGVRVETVLEKARSLDRVSLPSLRWPRATH